MMAEARDLHFDDQSKPEVVFFFSLRYFLREIENRFSALETLVKVLVNSKKL